MKCILGNYEKEKKKEKCRNANTKMIRGVIKLNRIRNEYRIERLVMTNIAEKMIQI